MLYCYMRPSLTRISPEPAWVATQLRRRYGAPGRRRRGAPFDALVATVLSQNTTDANSARTFAALRARFPRWEDMAAAPPRRIAAAIRAGGLADVKAAYLKAITRRVLTERGRLSLSFLARMSTAAAQDWLTALPGVGVKTARVVLLFAFGRDCFPVDTHILRLSRRLGFIPARAGAAVAHRWWDDHCPPRLAYELHLNLIRHGRECCHARKPACGACVLRDRCPSREGGR
jgi:endonuclease-3